MNRFNVYGLTAALIFVGQAQAADNFVGFSYGQTSDNIRKSSQLNRKLDDPSLDGVIRHDSTYGLRFGQIQDGVRYYGNYEYVDGHRHGYKLRQQNLFGSLDGLAPLNNAGTYLFGGGSLGLSQLKNTSPGLSRHSDIGYLAGIQLGALQRVSDAADLELGYRYNRSNAKFDVSRSGDGKLGSLSLHSSEQFYLGVNYRF